MTLFLTAATCLAALALLGVVAFDLLRITRELERIGGSPTSFLAKIRFGLRAIETETGALGPQVGRLNSGLRFLDQGLRSVEANLGEALAKWKGGSA